MANIAFVTEEVNRSVGAASPDVYLKEISEKVLRSQCIPAHRELWRIDTAEEFWDARRRLLADSFNDFLRAMLPGRRIDA